jgi:hypothetical protein
MSELAGPRFLADRGQSGSYAFTFSGRLRRRCPEVQFEEIALNSSFRSDGVCLARAEGAVGGDNSGALCSFRPAALYSADYQAWSGGGEYAQAFGIDSSKLLLRSKRLLPRPTASMWKANNRTIHSTGTIQGYCAMYGGKLTGYCSAYSYYSCAAKVSTACPSGKTATKPGYFQCSDRFSRYVDLARGCGFN